MKTELVCPRIENVENDRMPENAIKAVCKACDAVVWIEHDMHPGDQPVCHECFDGEDD